MQLSLPAAPFPTPAAPPACGAKTPASPTSAKTDSPDTPADSFDSLLKKDASGDDSKDDSGKTGADAEQAAGILAAVLWMQNPVTATQVPVPPAVLPDANATATATEVAGLTDGTETTTQNSPAITAFFGATNSRAFGKIQPASNQVPVAPFVAVSGDQVATPAADGQGTPVASKPVSAPDHAPVAGQTPITSQPAQCDAGTEIAGKAAKVVSPVADNSLNTSVVTEKVAVTTTVPNLLKSAAAPNSKIPAKNATDGKVAIQADENSDSTVDEISSPTTVLPVTDKLTATTAFSAGKNDSQPATPPAPDAQEKIAPLPAVLKDLEKSAAKVVEKYFLEPAQKVVTAASTSVGIAVAKVNATMSSASSARTKSASLVEPSASFVFSADTAPTATLTVDAPAPVATVRETLAAVISAVDAIERRADVQQKSVDLNFNVGNEKLGLRVELKDGAVHTTFRTESPEMTSALSREWHSVVPTSVGREVRVAEPVFHTVASSGSDSSFTSLGQGAPHQQREQPKAAPTFASALRREFNDSSAQETASPVASTAANSSQLLNALA